VPTRLTFLHAEGHDDRIRGHGDLRRRHARIAPVDRVKDPGHLARTPHRWNSGLLARANGRDGVRHGAADQALGGSECQKCAQRAQFLLDRLDLVARQRGDERLDRGSVGASQAATCARERDEFSGHRSVRAHRRRGAVRGSKPRLESGNRIGILSESYSYAPFRDRVLGTRDFVRTIFEYLQASIQKAGSVDPQKIAQAMEGMAPPDMLNRPTVMRADDHQLMFPYYVSMFSKDVQYDSEKTGLGWKPVKTYEGKDLTLPTTCKMKRPGV